MLFNKLTNIFSFKLTNIFSFLYKQDIQIHNRFALD